VRTPAQPNRLDGPCVVIMQSGVLLPGMVMPRLGPPPPDPHPDKRIQEMREAWDLRIVEWAGVWPLGYGRRLQRREVEVKRRGEDAPRVDHYGC
jgi:hypothetical protein